MEEITTSEFDSDLPLSPAIRHGDTIYVSGQGPLDPDTGAILGETATEQTTRTLENVDRILAAAGATLEDVLKVTVYLTDMSNYEAVNRAYRAALPRPYPARTAVEVASLPVDIAVELDVIAAAPDG